MLPFIFLAAIVQVVSVVIVIIIMFRTSVNTAFSLCVGPGVL